MSLMGARGIARIATNLECETQAAMVADRYPEDKLYRALMGQDYPREYGERLSARRRGAKFETNLYENNAALLRRATAHLYGHNAGAMWVRNFADELPGETQDGRAMRAFRLQQVLRDLSAGRRVPDLIIQPALPMKIPAGVWDVRFISPDFLILDLRSMIYVPGELKSFIVRDVGPNPGDLAPTRLQAAVEITSLRSEAERVGLADRVSSRAVFVFAKPYGLMPTDGVEEHLDAELDMVARAIVRLGQALTKTTRLRTADAAKLPDIVVELGSHFQESCITNCALADYCRTQHVGRPAELGDAAVDLFGSDADLDRLAQLVFGAAPMTQEEVAMASALRDAWAALGIDDFDTGRRTA